MGCMGGIWKVGKIMVPGEKGRRMGKRVNCGG
jgi:hypothetical protein